MTQDRTPHEAAQEAADDDVCFRFSNAEFDGRRQELRVAGKPVDLEPRTQRLLAELLRHPNEVVTKEELFHRVWDGRPTVDNAIANAVSKLRAALGPQAAAHIVTVPRRGYRLDGPVQRVESPPQPHLVLRAGDAVPGRPGHVLERPLGHGAHADVWLGRHAQLGQGRVYKFADDGARLTALKREYTLYRLLAHELGPRPEFAVVVDAQFHTAPYFLECEYGGQSLLDWADQPEAPLATMPRTERLALFVSLVRAVATAHGVGVLHKDIKPGNVLIDGVPGAYQLRLTDFGSGRLLDRNRLQGLQMTALGLTQALDGSDSSHSGTLPYLAPEVRAGQAASVQSDVYALGLLLYQWLVGDLRRAMATGWERDVDDPLLRQDIAAATDGDPAARLATAAELAQRLATLAPRREQAARHAEEAAQQARLAAALARNRARRPWRITALAVLLLGTVLSLWQYQHARSAWQRSEQALKTAEATLDFLTDDVMTTPDLSRAGGQRPRPLLELARQGAARAGRRFAGLPVQEVAARQHLARTFQRLGSLTDAVPQYVRAQELLAPLVAADDERLLTLQLELALTLFELGGGPNHPPAHRLVAAARQAAGETRLAQPGALAVLAARAQVAALGALGRDSAAVAAARELLALADRGPAAAPLARIEARRVLAEHLLLGAESAKAEAEADRILAELDHPPLNARPESALARVAVDLRRAALAREAGRLADARRAAQLALQRLDGPAPPSLWHLGQAHAELALAHEAAGETAAAAEHFRRALDAQRALLGDQHPLVLVTTVALGDQLLRQGRPSEAAALCDDGLDAAAKAAPGGRYVKLDWLCGRTRLALHQPAQALTHLDALPIPGADALPEGVDHWPWVFMAAKGVALEQAGRPAEGRRLIAQAQRLLAQFHLLPVGEPLVDRRLARAD